MKNYLLFILLFISVSFFSSALEVNSFKTFSLNNPLSYQYVRAIEQDANGFMWFGTHDGLHRFDGYQFVSYHHDSSDLNSLSSDMISALVIDQKQNIWIATLGGGVNFFNEKTQKFQRFSTKSEHIKLSDNNVNALLEDTLGNIWIGTEKGLNILFKEGDSWQVKLVTQELGNPNSLSHNTIETILQTDNNEIWVGTNGGGISTFDLRGNFIKQIKFSKNQQSHRVSNLIKVLYQDNAGYIWIGTADDGLVKLNPQTNDFNHYKFDESNRQSLSSNIIEKIIQSSDGSIWLATDKGGLIYNQKNDTFQKFQHSASNPHSLTNDFVLTFFEDKNNLMWIGTFSGVNRWDPNMTTFKQYNSDKHPELSNSLVMSFSQKDDKNIFFSTYNGGIYQLSLFNNEIYHQSFGDKFKDIRITTLFVDDDILWVGSRSSGLYKVNLLTEEVASYKNQRQNPSSLSANSVTDIIKDDTGQLWVSTYHQGINLLNSDGSFTRFVKAVEGDELFIQVNNHDSKQGSYKSPSTNHVLQMLEDSQGFIWLATYGGGINRFDPKTKSFVHLSHSDDIKTSLSSDLSWLLFQDKVGNLWVGTQSAGLNILSADNLKKNNFSFEHLDVTDGMRDQTIYGIDQDSQGNIWFSSNKGISRYSIDHKSFKHFGASHGLLALEYNYGAIFKGLDHTLYFGSVKGFTSVNLDDNVSSQPAPKVALTNILKLNEKMLFDAPLAELASLSLDYNDQLISFDYVGLNYSEPESTRYKYRLLGFDEQWIDAGKLRRATYTNLPSGNYQLQVIAGNNDNMWSEPSINLAITVKAAPWNSWWAYLLYALLVALALLSYSRILNRKLVIEQKQKHFLKQQIEEKTQKYLEKNVELEQANKQLENAATTDKLTGVKSRRYLDIYIEQASQLMAQIHQNILPVQRSVLPRLYLLMVKINNPSQVNDSQLINLTDLLQYTRNQDDLVIRWSEDTFAIIGYEKEDNARELAQRLTARIKNVFVNTDEVNNDMSVAYSFYPFNREQPMELSWDQVSVMTEQSLDRVSRSETYNWLGLHQPKNQPFSYLELLQVKSDDELSKIVKVKQG